jgi:hypothetical protein
LLQPETFPLNSIPPSEKQELKKSPTVTTILPKFHLIPTGKRNNKTIAALFNFFLQNSTT